jgi:hypothetical protein
MGANASVKAGANVSAFESATFALRGLARELGPQGSHVAHLIVDGAIWSDRAPDTFGLQQARCLNLTNHSVLEPPSWEPGRSLPTD